MILDTKEMKYNNSYDLDVVCPVMDLKEIFAEKIRTINDRARPRDCYDLVMLRKYFVINIKESIDILKKKEMHNILDKKNIKDNIAIILDRFDKEMKELYYKEKITKNEINNIVNEILLLL